MMRLIAAERQRRAAQEALDEELEQAGASLTAFIKAAWHVLEPGQPYKHGWHIDAIGEHLEAVTDGQITRLLINVPPGTSKSLSVGVMWPAWEWGPRQMPHLRYVGTSHSLPLAIRDNLKMRRLVASRWYQERWPTALMSDQNAKLKFENDSTGFREAMAFTGLTGTRGDRVLIDDPLSVDDAASDAIREDVNITFREAVPSRLNNPDKSAIIVIMQRLHENDVSGLIMAKDFGYEHLCYPADVEVLARSGWKRFADLAPDEAVMGVDPQTLRGRWEVPTAYIRYPYKGVLHRWSSDVLDLAVTPDHRMVFKDYNDWKVDRRLSWRVAPAASLPKHFYVPQAVVWEGNGDAVTFGGRVWKPEVFAEFMGWYLAEGCASAKGCSTRIVQREGAFVSEITALLADSPFPAKPRRHCRDGMLVWQIGSKALAEDLALLGKSHDKRVPDAVKSLAPLHLQRFLVAFAKGDGHFAKRNPAKITIGSRSRRLIDDLQECAVKAGWAASVSSRYDAGGDTFNGYVRRAGVIWKLYIRASKAPGETRKWYAKVRAANCSTETYDGDVFCVSVPSTALVVRRNGRVSISGNCLPMEFEPERRCMTSIGFKDPRTVDGELLFPARFPLEVVERDKIVMGPYAVAGQFQQRPAPREGGLFKAEWLRPYDKAPPRETMRIYGGSDYAVTADGGDYTVHVVVGLDPEGRMYLLDLWREQASADRWIEAFCDMVQQWNPLAWSEELGQIRSGVGPFLVRRMRERNAYVYRESFPTRGDKAVRAQSIRGRMALDGLYVPTSAPWYQAFASELTVFPAGKNDDQVDALGLVGQLLDKMLSGRPAPDRTPKRVLLPGQVMLPGPPLPPNGKRIKI